MTVQSDITGGIPVSLGPALYRIVTPPGIPSGEVFGSVTAGSEARPSGIASATVFGTATTVATVDPDSVDASTGSPGLPSAVLVARPSGVSGSVSAGQPATTASLEPDPIVGAAQFGAHRSFTSMNPASVTAAGGGPGDPMLAQSMHPTGTSSAIQFGDADTIATVFIVPGPVDPSNDFGNAIARSKRLIFRTPTQTLGWGWYKRFEGISVIKKDGTWQEIPWPTIDETVEADIYLGGGRDHAVSTALAAELIAEGYSISEEF